MSNIKPELPGGFQDYLPSRMIPRQELIDTIRNTFERFGFMPLDTPAIEWREVLTGGDPNFDKEIFEIERDTDSKAMALRFDLTVSLARVISAYPQEIDLPFKRYQVGRLWRGEKPQLGRYKEFKQFDADIVGTKSMMADAEIIASLYESLTSFGVSDFVIKINDRKVLNGLPMYANFSEKKITEVIRIIDKLDKIGWNGVKEELMNSNGVKLERDQVNSIKEFIEIKSSASGELFEKAESMLSGSKEGMEGLQELREVSENLEALGVSQDKWEIDFSIARGMDYYTGPIFEAVLTEFPSIGSIASGGRYDGLVKRFSPTSIPATGGSIGVDRLFNALEELESVETVSPSSQVLILNFDPSCRIEIQEIATNLRNSGISTEIFVGNEETLKGQLSYGVKKEFPAIIILGSEEKEKNVVQLKDVEKHEQREIGRNDLIPEVKKILE